MRRFAILVAVASVTAPLAAASPATDAAIRRAVSDPARPADSAAADALRLPAETLAFSGLRRGMVVGEFFPGGGYFTRLISDVVGPRGHVYGIENEKWKGAVEGDKALLAEKHYRNVSIAFLPFGTVAFPKKLDLAWVTQNYHDLKIAEYGAVDTIAFDKAVFDALKPGGTFFILDHQGRAGMSADEIAKMHRINKDEVIREVTSVGFKLAAEGHFLNRPGDDHSKSIFDKAIQGHTDQYALKFVKPRR